jgi:hypothetical protein
MKTIFILAFLSVAFLTRVSLHAEEFTGGGVYASSPDHPSTWVNGADNIHQALRWDPEKHMLFADVKYSTILYADSVHPTEENDYALSFPSVRLDSATGVFKANGVRVGILRHGFFGSHIVLDKNVELDIHRHHGRIFAVLGPSEQE